MKTGAQLLAEAIVLQESGAQGDELIAWLKSVQADALRHAAWLCDYVGNYVGADEMRGCRLSRERIEQAAAALERSRK